MSSNHDGDKTQWFHDLIAWETEGEITPAQAPERGAAVSIQIKADFRNRRFRADGQRRGDWRAAA